jgi:hypothetical protein
MDISKIYIKMCDCSEIQGFARNNIFNKGQEWWVNKKNRDVWIDHDGNFSIRAEIWLPRQDQIQEMMEYKFNLFGLIYSLYEFGESIRNPAEPYPFKTLEQLWFAFYMHEKHEKIWNGERWQRK